MEPESIEGDTRRSIRMVDRRDTSECWSGMASGASAWQTCWGRGYLATKGCCRKGGAVKGSEVSGFFEPRSGGPPYLPDIRTRAGTDVVTRNTEGSDEQLAAGNRA